VLLGVVGLDVLWSPVSFGPVSWGGVRRMQESTTTRYGLLDYLVISESVETIHGVDDTGGYRRQVNEEGSVEFSPVRCGITVAATIGLVAILFRLRPRPRTSVAPPGLGMIR
jgi:hypothetical protein